MKRLLRPSLFRRYLFTAAVLAMSLFLALFAYVWFERLDAESISSDLTLAAHGLLIFTESDDELQIKIAAEKVRALHLKFVSPKPSTADIQYVLFRNGRIVAASEKPPMEIIDPLKAKPPEQAIYEGGWYLAAATNESTRTVAFFATSESFARRILRDAMLNSLLIVGLNYLALLLFASSLAAAFATRPIVALARRIRSLKPGSFETLKPRTAYSELEPVVAAINERTDALKRQIDTERQFFSNAAHELRTPLAVIHAQAHGVAHAKNSEDRGARLAELQRGVDRAARSLGRMLQLARLDTAAPSIEKTQLSMRDIAADCIAFHAPRAFANNQALSLSDSGDAHVHGNRDDLVTILDNLLDNAINYAGTGADIVVTIDTDALRAIQLSVCDNGPGFSKDDHRLAFERFRRGSQSHNVQGSGLGLSIVRAAAARLGARIATSDRKGGGLCVSLVFTNRAQTAEIAQQT